MKQGKLRSVLCWFFTWPAVLVLCLSFMALSYYLRDVKLPRELNMNGTLALLCIASGFVPVHIGQRLKARNSP